jgi:hypothetical protein
MEESTPVAAQSNKKVLYIIIGVLALLLVGAVVTGAFGRGTGLGSAYFAPGVDVDQNLDGSTTYTSEDGSGSVTVGSGASMPSNWPSDAPTAYSGATIAYSGTTNPSTGESGSAVVYTTSASAASVVEYYDSRLKAEGWTIEASVDMGGTRVITAKKDTRTIGVYVQDAGNGITNVTAGVQL